MADICTKIKLYAKSKGVNSIDFLTDVIVEKLAGEESKIKTWNLSIDEPTADQLNNFESAGNTEESNNAVRATRKKLYGDIGDQLDEIYTNIDAWKARIKKIKDDNPKE
jgi:hypothetical protein